MTALNTMITILLFTNPAPIERIPKKDTPEMKAFSNVYLVNRLGEHCHFTYLDYRHHLSVRSSSTSQIPSGERTMTHTIKRNDANVSWNALMIQAD